MAKKSSTIHLDLSTWDEIKEYQDKYGCSRNDAIERMFVERRLLVNMNESRSTATQIKKEPKQEIDSKLKGAVNDTYNDMPE